MKKIIFIFYTSLMCLSCNKANEWLDVKQNRADLIPTTLADLQALLDNSSFLFAFGTVPSMGTLSADNFYVTTTEFLSASSPKEQAAYTWAADLYQGTNLNDWDYPYKAVAYCNIVLEGLGKIERTAINDKAWDQLKGIALFYRAFAFYHLVNLFAPQYQPGTAVIDPGIPLRLSSDANQPITRASVLECFTQIEADLKESIVLLPGTPDYKTRPCAAASYTMLARTALHKHDYVNAELYATESLNLFNTLLNYNSLAAGSSNPFPAFQNNNPEIVFYATALSYSLIAGDRLARPDSILYSSYHVNDLRKSLFYKPYPGGRVTIYGSYSGMHTPFAGIAVNEVYLIRAEARARINKTAGSISDLNTLLIKRYKTGTFIPLTAATADAALSLVLAERRKELPMTANTRWEDLRRLNIDPKFAITIKRIIDNQLYELAPNDPKYVLPIPDQEIRLSGIAQNKR